MPNHMFTGASIGTISGGTFVNNSEKSAEKLSVAVAHSALHDGPARTDESRCHQHTRTNVLDNLERWSQGICNEGASILWLYGGAGAGKSAVMQTLAERCAAQGLSLGSFFFSRSDPTRNTAEVLIPTLIYQLALLFPSAMDVLGPIIDRDLLIFKKSFQVQILTLFVPLLHYLVQLGTISNAPQSPRVFLIDGLDECNDHVQQQTIIRAVAAVCNDHRMPVKFLIASRPEHQISTSFQWYSQANRALGSISLSEDPDAENDIRRFIEAEFLRIRLQHPFNHMIPSEWPGPYNINRLVWKSSSHFIYAKTAMKYIWSTKENPVRSLGVVLGLQISRTVSPFAELDSLYHHILGSAAHLDQVLRVLAHCMFSSMPSKVGVVCIMLERSVEDLSIFLADMGPLVLVSKSTTSKLYDPNDHVQLLHQSLGDFLSDTSRSLSLYINRKAYLASTLERCFQLLNQCSQNQFIDWPETDWTLDLGNLYYQVKTQILDSVYTTVDTIETQELLGLYTLSNFHDCQLALSLQHSQRIQDEFYTDSFDNNLDAHHVSRDLVRYVQYLQSRKIGDGGSLLRNFLEDFFDIFQSHLLLECKPLEPVVLPLLFSGYPATSVCDILSHCCSTSSANPFCNINWFCAHDEGIPLGRDAMSFLLIYGCMELPLHAPGQPTDRHMERITSSDLASIRHSVNASIPNLTAAAEAVLRYLPSIQPISHGLTIWGTFRPTPHEAWLQRTKPGKRLSTGLGLGSPNMASRFHRQCLHIYEDIKTADSPQRRRKYGPYLERIGLPISISTADWRKRIHHGLLYFELLRALIWLLPKASYSECIIFYSRRIFSREVYQRNPRLFRRLKKSLDGYFTRVQDEKLQALSRRIDEGDRDALTEKSQMLHLNAQD